MAFSLEQQAIELITKSKRILIVTKERPSIDALASVTALFGYLKKMNMQVDAIAPGCDLANAPSFLPGTKDIRSTIGAMRAFKLDLDVSKTPLSEVLYDVKDGKLEITVVPKSGEWTPKDVTFRSGEDRYDLVIAVDCPDYASLGGLFKEHADFIYRTTVVNIDRDPTNEHWGQVNLVDFTAVSTTEVLFGMFERWNRHAIDEDVATALLAGMIAKTNSFRTIDVTPKTMQTASALISIGARREEIVHGLWRTKSVQTLKLWGRALSRLEYDRELGLVWSTLTQQDFADAGAGESALEGIVDELVGYAPEAKVIALISGERVTIHAMPPYSANDLGRAFGCTGSRDHVSFSLASGTSPVDGTKMVIEKLKTTMKALKR